MKDVKTCREADFPATVGFSAVDHTKSSESKIGRVEKEIKASGFKDSASSDLWERTNQTVSLVIWMCLNRNLTQLHISFG